jgi:alpha-tubulin suppressor-like RCC1 family protein
VSFRYAAGFNKPGFNPLVAPTPSYVYNLYAWGANVNGALGLNNTTNYSSPKQVGSEYWTVISESNSSSFAIKNDGTLWGWGQGASGQLGLGNKTAYSSPKQLGALTTWATVNAYNAFTAAIKTD